MNNFHKKILVLFFLFVFSFPILGQEERMTQGEIREKKKWGLLVSYPFFGRKGDDLRQPSIRLNYFFKQNWALQLGSSFYKTSKMQRENEISCPNCVYNHHARKFPAYYFLGLEYFILGSPFYSGIRLGVLNGSERTTVAIGSFGSRSSGYRAQKIYSGNYLEVPLGYRYFWKNGLNLGIEMNFAHKPARNSDYTYIPINIYNRAGYDVQEEFLYDLNRLKPDAVSNAHYISFKFGYAF
jgi:hypothetical protein